MENKEMIYDVMLGVIDKEERGIGYVQDEFAAGSLCDKLYNEVFAANQRICKRLMVQSDRDVESIIDNLMSISRHLALKMFDYGCYFSSPSSK